MEARDLNHSTCPLVGNRTSGLWLICSSSLSDLSSTMKAVSHEGELSSEAKL